MEKQQISPEKARIYDFDELGLETVTPVRFVCDSIKTVIEPMIRDRDRFRDVRLGVQEIVKDVEVHGNESYPRLVIVQQEIGGVALRTIDVEDRESTRTDIWGEDPDHNGFGEQIIESVFQDDYKKIVDGDTVERYVFIRGDNATQQYDYPRIEHVA